MYIFIYLYIAVAYIYKKITGWILYKMHRELRVKAGGGVGGIYRRVKLNNGLAVEKVQHLVSTGGSVTTPSLAELSWAVCRYRLITRAVHRFGGQKKIEKRLKYACILIGCTVWSVSSALHVMFKRVILHGPCTTHRHY